MAISAADINDRPSFEAWLNSRLGHDQDNVALALASRTALRVLPIVGSGPPNSAFARLLLETLRALLISRIALVSPSKKIVEAARDLGGGTDFSYDISHSPASNAARSAAAVAAMERTTSSVICATLSAEYAWAAASEGIWEAISVDAERLENAEISPAALINSPLWPNGRPEWWAQSIAAFGTFLLDLDKYSSFGLEDHESRSVWQVGVQIDKDWSIWQEWLNSVSNGRQSFNLPKDIAESLEKRIALGDGSTDFWKFDNPTVVSSPISGSGFLGLKGVEASATAGNFEGTVSEARIRIPNLISSKIAEWVREAKALAAVYQAQGSGLQFVLVNKLITLSRGLGLSSDSDDQIRINAQIPILRELVTVLEAKLTEDGNKHTELMNSLRRIKSILERRNKNDIGVTELFTATMVFSEQVASAANPPFGINFPPFSGPDVATAKSIANISNLIVLGTEEGRKLFDDADRQVSDAGENSKYKIYELQLLDLIAQNGSVIDSETIDLLRKAAAASDLSVTPLRSRFLSSSSVRSAILVVSATGVTGAIGYALIEAPLASAAMGTFFAYVGKLVLGESFKKSKPGEIINITIRNAINRQVSQFVLDNTNLLRQVASDRPSYQWLRDLLDWVAELQKNKL